MKQSSKNVLWIVLVIVVGFVAYRLLFPPMPDDRTQIANNIQTAIEAAQAKDANGMMRVVSDHYVDENGLSNDALRYNLVRSFNTIHRLTVSASESEITVSGDEAHTVTYVSLTASGESGSVNAPRTEVVLTWKKEPATKFLIFPTTAWRVVKATYGSFE